MGALLPQCITQYFVKVRIRTRIIYILYERTITSMLYMVIIRYKP